MLAQAQEFGADSIKNNNGLFVPKFMKWLNEEYKLKDKSPQYYTAIRSFNNHIKIYFRGKKQTVGTSKIIIKSPKTEEGIRPLALIDIVYEALMEWQAVRFAQEKVSGIQFTNPDSYLFANDKGELRSEWGTNSLFQRFKKRHNLKDKGIHFHAMRQTLSNTLFELMKNDEASIIKTMGHTSIDTTKKNYHTLGKFDSVQKVARSFNELYPPKNSIYKALENTTFAPDGYLSEEKGVGLNIPIEQQQAQAVNETDNKLDVQALIKEISLHPELIQLLQSLIKAT